MSTYERLKTNRSEDNSRTSGYHQKVNAYTQSYQFLDSF